MKWQHITKKEPDNNEENVLLACNGVVIGILTGRWTEIEDEDIEVENWSVNDNYWDGDTPMYFLRIPAPPE